MRVVVALGGNALLRRGQAMTADNQRENVKTACRELAEVAQKSEHRDVALAALGRIHDVADIERSYAAARTAGAVEETLDTMRTWYNGYRFARGEDDLLYNPTNALYFLKHLFHFPTAGPNKDKNKVTAARLMDYLSERA